MVGASGLVSGRYRVGELLGTGGSASVFAAVDTLTESPVALKILHPHLSERPVAREAFFTEARRAEPLRHPNIVGVLGVGVDESGDAPIAWIALERAAGSSLAEHVARHGALHPAEAAGVAVGTLRALEAAHAIGLIHRDVSPSNIMVAPNEAGVIVQDGVRLLDFGLADAAGATAIGTDDLLSVEATGRSGVLGNVNYISPEHVRGEPVDERGDIYQVGAVLSFALTARAPFARPTTGQTMRAHLDTPPPVPSVLDSRIPRTLDRIVVRAMLKDPRERFASAAEMRRALAEASSSASTSPATAASTSPATDDVGVTRVLGRTMVPPRAAGAGSREAGASGRSPRRARSRAGTWFGVTTAAIVTAMIVAFAATSTPTASIQADPTTGPSATPTQTAPTSEPSPAPEPEPVVEPVEPMVAVPDLGRLTVSEAVRALADAGLVAGEISYVDSALLRDVVLESRPAAGDQIADGETVGLVVASGLNSVPDVAGQSYDAAFASVQSAGFAPSPDRRYVGAASQAGHILGTDPGAGARLAVGTPVSVLEAVFNGPTPAPSQTTPPPTPNPTTVPDAGGLMRAGTAEQSTVRDLCCSGEQFRSSSGGILKQPQIR